MSDGGKGFKRAENLLKTPRGQSPIAGAGEIREYSVDTAYTIADYRGSGEGREGDVTKTIADCWGWLERGFADAAWTIAACLREFAVWECQPFGLGSGVGGSCEGD